MTAFAGGSALAQTAAQPAGSSTPAAGGASDPVASLNEVVVTATRQEQLISHVPLSISAFTRKSLDVQGVRTFEDLVRFTPGVTFDPATSSIAVRGISSTAGAGTTGVYIDDTPIQIRFLGYDAVNTLPSIFDLDRVEVLRGPQGTLFGAGSEGGTVRFITPQPSLTTYSAYGRAEVSSTDGGGVSGEFGVAVGGPIVADTLGFRLSAWQRHDGGYVDRIDPVSGRTAQKDANSADTTVVRGALTWQPTSSLSVTPSIYFQQHDIHDTDQFWEGISDRDDGALRQANPQSSPNTERFVLPSLKIEYHFAKVDVISNTSYFSRNGSFSSNGSIYDLDYFQQELAGACGGLNCRTDLYPLLTPNGPRDLPGFGTFNVVSTAANTQNDLTQEIRFQSSEPDARVNWVGGLFYQANRQTNLLVYHDPQFEAISQYLFGESATDFFGSGLVPGYGDADYYGYTVGHDDQVAGFADVTVRLFGPLKLEAGVRVARAHFDFVSTADGPLNFGHTVNTGANTEYPVTPKASLQYQADANNLFYATYSKGYRDGGANSFVPANACGTDLAKLGLSSAPSSYASDTVDNFEVGAKNKLFDGRLNFEGSAYYIKWNGIQENVYLPSCGFQFTSNIGEAVSQGADLQFQFRIVRGLTGALSVGYTDAYYSKVVQSGPGVIANKGDALPVAPWTVALGLQYNTELGAYPVYGRFDDQFASHNSRLTPSQDPIVASYDPDAFTPPATNFMSLRAGVTLNRFEVSVFADNLLNSQPELTRTHDAVGALLFEQTTFRPRTVGLTGIYRY